MSKNVSMKDLLLLRMKNFLDPREKGPLLVGCSGGPDSKALLYLLRECRKFYPLDLEVAHIDHGWREQSAEEARQLHAEVEKLGFAFHLKILSPKDFRPGNFEEQGRELRLKFFGEVYEKIGAKALLLGHQADDQAETVLKRVFEGASLFSLGGLAFETALGRMRVWRPLLHTKKSEILAWLADKNLTYFEDATNRDERFLRGKMREKIFPSIAASFGKEISGNLCRLGEESQEIKAYFQEINRPILESFQGNLAPFLPMPLLQLKFFLRAWMEREKVSFSRQIVDGIVEALNQNQSKRKFIFKHGEVSIEKGRISLIKINNLIK